MEVEGTSHAGGASPRRRVASAAFALESVSMLALEVVLGPGRAPPTECRVSRATHHFSEAGYRFFSAEKDRYHS